MKKITIILSLTLCVMTELIATPIISEVKTEQATVFLQGAQLEQTAKIALQKGENEVRLEGLAPYIDEQSLQLSLTNDAVITAFRFSLDYMRQTESTAAVTQLKQQLTDAEKQYNEVENKVNINANLIEMLKSGVTTSLEAEEHPLQGEAIEKQLVYYKQRSEQLLQDKYALEQQLKQLSDRKEALQNQLRQEGKNKQKSGVVTMTVQAKEAGQVSARLKYFTSSARWIPYYDMVVKEVGQPISLTLKAKVMQSTGMMWQQVHLVLSTYMPSKNNQVPEFTRWALRQREEHIKYARKGAVARAVYEDAAPMMMEKTVMSAEERDEEVYEENAMVNLVQAEEQSLMATYNISVPYNIEGNNKEQVVALQEQQIDNVEYQYQTLPKLDTDVYLVALIKDWQKLSLLSGDVNLTYGTTYFGQTNINTASTQQIMPVALGTDPQISVKRELQDENSKKAVLTSNITKEYTYKITISNNKKQSAKVVLKEQYPVSTAKDIQVELLETTSQFTDNDKQKGVLTFEQELAPGESRTLIVAFSVRYPKDWQINL